MTFTLDLWGNTNKQIERWGNQRLKYRIYVVIGKFATTTTINFWMDVKTRALGFFFQQPFGFYLMKIDDFRFSLMERER